MKSKSLKITLISALACVFALALAAFVPAFASGESRGDDVKYEFFVGEKTAVDDLVNFDDDGIRVIGREVRNVADNTVCEIKGGSFVAEKAGVYKITLIKRDDDGKSFSSYYYAEAKYSDKAIIANKPAFPYAFVSGKNYALAEPQSYLYSQSGKTKADYTVKASVNGAELAVKEGKITPVAEKNGDIAVIEYTVKGKDEANDVTLVYKIPVIQLFTENDDAIMQNVFVTDKIDSAVIDFTESAYIAGVSSSGASLRYANPIPADAFKLRWKMNKGYGNFESFSIVLTDYEDETQVVRLTFSPTGGAGIYISINGAKPFTMMNQNKVDNFDSGTFTVSYSASKKSVSDINGVIGKVTTFEDGRAFTGFESGIVKFALEFGEVTEYSNISLLAVANQTLAVEYDQINPLFFYKDEIRVRYKQGDTIKINKGQAYDMLDPNATITVDVYKISDDGDVLDEIPKDNDGNPLRNYDCSKDVYIKVDEICNYRVVYVAKDSMKKAQDIYKYVIGDAEAPVVKFGVMENRCKVGDAVKLPSVSYTDNGGNDNVTVLVTYLTPDNVVEVLEKDAVEFTPAKKGVYKVRIMVYDKQYNYVFKEFVTEAV